MTSIRELFPKSRKLAYDVRQRLSQVQNDAVPPSELHISLDELNRQLDTLETLLHRETPAQREIWKRKILQLREDASSVRSQGEYYERMVGANVRVRREREELLTRRRRGKGGGGGGEDGDVENGIRDMSNESNSLISSNTMVGEMLQTGEAQLSSLVSQRRRMTGIKRVVFDIGNKLGLTDQTMKIIQRRDVTDGYFVLGGMVVTCFVMYVVWFR